MVRDRPAFNENLNSFKKERDLRKRLIPKLRTALYHTIGIILCSVLILILTPFISKCGILPYIVFVIGFGWLLYCMWSYYQLIMETIFDEG
jgi:hypothetical protein